MRVSGHGLGGWFLVVLTCVACDDSATDTSTTQAAGECEPACGQSEVCRAGACVDAAEDLVAPTGPAEAMAPSGASGEAEPLGNLAPIGPEPDAPAEDEPPALGTDAPAGPTAVPTPTPTPTTRPTDSPTPIDLPTLPPLEGAAGKVDLLFVMDNSQSMAHSHRLFVDSVPHLIARLADPRCLAADGTVQASIDGECPAGAVREFAPVADLHVGVVTSSLGAAGAEHPCANAERGEHDSAHLMGSLARVGTAVPGGPEFLSWCTPSADAPCDASEQSDPNALIETFRNQAAAIGETGCGFEATLEAFHRFLVEPFPWTRVVRQNCPFGGDTNQLCVGPETDATGAPLIDAALLAQRRAFLRPDSLLVVAFLTNENDCSFKASGQSWRLAEVHSDPTGSGQFTPNRAYKGTAACLTDPNGECCTSCGVTTVPAGCPTVTSPDGQTVAAGCEAPRYLSVEDLALAGSNEATDDAANLRCFHQKQRFGVDYLYPVERYVNALTLPELCPAADTLSPDATTTGGEAICTGDQLVQNPLFVDFTYADRVAVDPAAEPIQARSPELALLMGIVGVPWQTLVEDAAAPGLTYATEVDWVRVLGNATPGAPDDPLNAPPTDPHMLEQVEARSGTDPAVNGGEWNILDKDELQYACIFPLPEPIQCTPLDDVTAASVPCDCTYLGDPSYANPLCNGEQQLFGKAFPSIRPLQVIRDLGPRGLATSICAKQTNDPAGADWAYRPAFERLLTTVRSRLGQ